MFEECPKARTCTIIMRGGAEQFIKEAERSLHDALCVVRSLVKNKSLTTGGGSVEVEVSYCLSEYANSLKGIEAIIFKAYAEAL